ncbi:MAG TPA: BamA/TamA family outer membrane protein [Vicinamibacterales bacterium]
MRALLLISAALFALPAVEIHAQEPQTRAEALAREREEKSKQLEPPQAGRLERALLTLENRRFFERILNPAEGFYPKIGNITPGSGFAGGPGYRSPRILGGEAQFSTFGQVSIQKYWMLDARLTMPDLAGGRLFADVHGRRYDYPEEDFFGLGPRSLREAHTTYALRSTDVGGTAGVRVAPWLSFGSGLELMTPRVAGLPDQPNFVRSEVSAEVNTREPRGNPRQGARYALAFQHFEALEDAPRDFQRLEADVQQYISIYKNRRVLALHAFASVSDPTDERDVPFYYQKTLGGPDDLRGFRQFRFRDRHMILLQAEYRWEIFTAMDGAIFYDAGKVASRIEDLNFADLESDYGIGFRFGTSNGVFLRVEGAFGSSGGAHFILRYGHVF